MVCSPTSRRPVFDHSPTNRHTLGNGLAFSRRLVGERSAIGRRLDGDWSETGRRLDGDCSINNLKNEVFGIYAQAIIIIDLTGCQLVRKKSAEFVFSSRSGKSQGIL